MSLVDDDILKGELLERGLFNETDFVGGDAGFKILRQEAIGNDVGTFLLCPC